ncbi:uncharacterized protein LOC113485882 [Athene cunicularia]|uniref:uncharacterized protein LOC113485882 n=1 Tax=Athene cunicularia TaxID=194338 RepID=UPI000EF67DAC|nr:uncharacterized protein LOC113485882 [Athene cunicularia]
MRKQHVLQQTIQPFRIPAACWKLDGLFFSSPLSPLVYNRRYRACTAPSISLSLPPRWPVSFPPLQGFSLRLPLLLPLLSTALHPSPCSQVSLFQRPFLQRRFLPNSESLPLRRRHRLPCCLDQGAPSLLLCYSLKLLTSQKCGQGSRRDYHFPNLSQTANQPATHLLPLNKQHASLTTETSATRSRCLDIPGKAQHGTARHGMARQQCFSPIPGWMSLSWKEQNFSLEPTPAASLSILGEDEHVEFGGRGLI